jgi:hypothetical protein
VKVHHGVRERPPRIIPWTSCAAHSFSYAFFSPLLSEWSKLTEKNTRPSHLYLHSINPLADWAKPQDVEIVNTDKYYKMHNSKLQYISSTAQCHYNKQI